MLKLVLPSKKYQTTFSLAITEFKAQKKKREIEESLIAEYERSPNFSDFVKKLRGQARGKYLSPGYVPCTTYWLVDGKKFVGWLNSRHYLNERLLAIGGHIGYAIRPSQRRQGYGKLILKLALIKARDLGIKKALVSCDDDNIGSRKIIETNGGVFENKVRTETGRIKRRYWIDLEKAEK